MTDTNPIEDLRRAVREIRAACGTTPPNMVLVSPAIPPALDAHADRAERRERKALRRGLSARYEQRRRQRAQGVAGVRHERRRTAARRLARSIPETRALAERMGGRSQLLAASS